MKLLSIGLIRRAKPLHIVVVSIWVVLSAILGREILEYNTWRASLKGEVWKLKMIPPAFILGLSTDSWNWTPLFFAASTGHVNSTRHLLSIGMSVDHRDKFGRTPLSWVSMTAYAEVAKLLIRYGADVTAVDDEGNTPLHFAASARNVDSRESQLGFRFKGQPEVILGTGINYMETATQLMDAGASPLAVNQAGVTPLGLARKYKMTELVRVMEDRLRRRK